MTIKEVFLTAASILLCVSGLPILEPEVVVRARTGLFPGRGRGRQVDLTRVLPISGQFWLNVDDGYFACQVNSTETFVKVFKISRLCDGLPDCFQGADELKDFLNCSDQCQNNNCGHQGTCLETSNQPKCYCNLGFRGDRCEKVHITQCTDSSCPPNSECIHTSGKSSCACKKGFIEEGPECVPDVDGINENQELYLDDIIEETTSTNPDKISEQVTYLEPNENVDFTTEISTKSNYSSATTELTKSSTADSTTELELKSTSTSTSASSDSATTTESLINSGFASTFGSTANSISTPTTESNVNLSSASTTESVSLFLSSSTSTTGTPPSYQNEYSTTESSSQPLSPSPKEESSLETTSSTVSVPSSDILSDKSTDSPTVLDSKFDQVIPSGPQEVTTTVPPEQNNISTILDSKFDLAIPSDPQEVTTKIIDQAIVASESNQDQDQFDNQLQQVLANVKKALERFLKQHENGQFDLEKNFVLPEPDLSFYSTTETIVEVTPATVRNIPDPSTSNVTGTLDILNELKTLLRTWTADENSNLEERFVLNQAGSDFKLENRLRDSSSFFHPESPDNLKFSPEDQIQDSSFSIISKVKLSDDKAVPDSAVLRSSDVKDDLSGNFSVCVEDYTSCKSQGSNESDICSQQFNACSIKILESSKVDKYAEADPLEFLKEINHENNVTTVDTKCVQNYINCLFNNDSGCAEAYNVCDKRNENGEVEARNDDIVINESDVVVTATATSIVTTTPEITSPTTPSTTTTLQHLNKFPTDKSNVIETSEKPLKETTPCDSLPLTFGSFSGSPAQTIADCTWDFFGCTDRVSSSGSNKNCCQARFDSCSDQVDSMKTKNQPKPQTTLSLPTITTTEKMESISEQITGKPTKPLNSLAECIWAFYSCQGGKSECQKSFDDCNEGKRATDVICAEAAEDPRKYLVPHPTDCNKFYSCQNLGWRGGWMAHLMDCPTSTVFDPKLRICNFPSDVGECRKGKTLALFQEIYAIAAKQTRQKQDSFQIPDVGYISSKNIVHSKAEEPFSTPSCQSSLKFTFSPILFALLTLLNIF